jgi:hypothetical protein
MGGRSIGAINQMYMYLHPPHKWNIFTGKWHCTETVCLCFWIKYQRHSNCLSTLFSLSLSPPSPPLLFLYMYMYIQMCMHAHICIQWSHELGSDYILIVLNNSCIPNIENKSWVSEQQSIPGMLSIYIGRHNAY